jgi:hypothetical protein
VDLHPRAPERPQPGTLTEAIHQVADCPCNEHQGAFLAALAATDELIFLVISANVSLANGHRHQIGAGDQVLLQRASAQGRSFLLAFPDLDAALRHNPKATYAGIGREQAIAMTLGDPELAGILIAATSHNDAWAAAGSEALAAMTT